MSQRFKRTRGVNCTKKHILMIDGERHEIKVKEDKSVWYKLKEFINSVPVGTLFARKVMLEYIYTVDVVATDSAADYYKCHLNTLGFISTERPGIYRKECDIPMHLTIKKVQEAARAIKTWKGWFIPVHERLGIDEQEAPRQQLGED